MDGEGQITTMEISRLAGVSYSFLLNVLPSLKDKGFVSVVRGETGKRLRFVKLTDGRRYLLHALECYRANLEGNYALIKRLVKSK